MNPSLLLSIAPLLTMTLLGVIDFRSGRMPNWITLGSWALALGAHGALSGAGGLFAALLASLLVAAGPLGLFVVTKGEAIGGGDIKALFALGAWLGVLPGLQAELLALVALAAVAYGREARRGRLGALLKRSFLLFVPEGLRAKHEEHAKTATTSPSKPMSLRFGPFLAAGTWVLCLATWLLPDGAAL